MQNAEHRNGIKHNIDTDIYWGEFPLQELRALTATLKKEGLAAARAHAREIGRDDFIFGIERSNFIHYLGLTSESVVLDCGAGLGVHTFNLAPLVKEVHAFDQSLARMEFCAARAQSEQKDNVYLYHSDFAHLDFPDERFDAILMNGVVEWLGEIGNHDDPRDDQIDVLRFLRQKLKPGGVLYIGIENRSALAYLSGYDHSGLRFTNYYPRWLANIVTKRKKGKPYRTYTYTKSGYDKLLADAGFEQEALSYYIAYPGYNLPRYIIPREDDRAIRFFIDALGGKKGLRGAVTKFLTRFPLGMWLLKHSFFAYLIFARKEKT